MNRRFQVFCATLPLLLVANAASAQEANCRVDAFRGALQPGGTTANMRVRNTGAACRIMNLGVPNERRNPATSGAITRPPAHGRAAFEPPYASYTPEPGYSGEDEFEYEASIIDIQNQPGRMKVKVKVSVLAPQ